eukprot:6214025-Pleurochrysis_carterae.AAC.8
MCSAMPAIVRLRRQRARASPRRAPRRRRIRLSRSARVWTEKLGLWSMFSSMGPTLSTRAFGCVDFAEERLSRASQVACMELRVRARTSSRLTSI